MKPIKVTTEQPGAKAPQRRMTEDELAALIDNEAKACFGNVGKLAKERQRNLAYYNAEPVDELAPPEAEGRSRVVSTDVADTVEWALPSLLKIFTSSDDAVVFEPENPDDEEGAKQRTDYANYVFYRQNEGFVILHNFLKDALIQRMGVLKVYWDASKDITREEYEGLTDGELAMLLQDKEVEVTEHTAYPAEGMQDAVIAA